MLVSLLLWPIFLVFGFCIGLLSPIVAICKACRKEVGKWQTYVRNASAVSRGHQKRIIMLARCFLVFECCSCYDDENLRGKRLLVDYYKLGHHLGFSFHIIAITLIKIVLFNPCWKACTSSLEDLKEAERHNLGEGLLRSGESRVSLQNERPPRNGRVMLRDVGSHEPGVSYQVERLPYQEEHIENPGESVSSNSFQHPSQVHEGYEGARHSSNGQNSYAIRREEPIYSGKPHNSITPEEAEPWGDWGAA